MPIVFLLVLRAQLTVDNLRGTVGSLTRHVRRPQLTTKSRPTPANHCKAHCWKSYGNDPVPRDVSTVDMVEKVQTEIQVHDETQLYIVSRKVIVVKQQ